MCASKGGKQVSQDPQAGRWEGHLQGRRGLSSQGLSLCSHPPLGGPSSSRPLSGATRGRVLKESLLPLGEVLLGLIQSRG